MTASAELGAAQRAEQDKADRERAIPGMVAAALGAYGTISDTVEGGIYGLPSHASRWFEDATDARGAAFREYVGLLVAIVKAADAPGGTQHG